MPGSTWWSAGAGRPGDISPLQGNSGVPKQTADEVGIAVTRLNAMLLAGALGDAACPLIAGSQAEAMAFGATGTIVLMGGVTPAQTTDAVAAVLAERCGADLMVNLTSVDGIYTADPRIDPAAERLARLTPEKLLEIVGPGSLMAGANTVIDMVAAKVIQRSGIPLLVIDGRDPDNLSKALLSGTHSGSLVIRGGERPASHHQGRENIGNYFWLSDQSSSSHQG